MTAGRGQYEQGPVSVDGAWFAAVDGEWRHVPNPHLLASTAAPSNPYTSGLQQAPVCIDGGWFAVVDDEWRQVPSPTFEARTGPTIPDGNNWIDGADKLSEQRHS